MQKIEVLDYFEKAKNDSKAIVIKDIINTLYLS